MFLEFSGMESKAANDIQSFDVPFLWYVPAATLPGKPE